jgi:hypothetical protein
MTMLHTLSAGFIPPTPLTVKIDRPNLGEEGALSSGGSFIWIPLKRKMLCVEQGHCLDSTKRVAACTRDSDLALWVAAVAPTFYVSLFFLHESKNLHLTN